MTMCKIHDVLLYVFQPSLYYMIDIGIGTIEGSAVFNILCVIGLCGILAGQVRLA